MSITGKIILFLFGFVPLLSGCMSGGRLPEGEVPASLVGEQNLPQENITTLKNAEAAMSGAIVRTLIRLGHSGERVPLAFSFDSTEQNPSFVALLTGTDMVRICGQDAAKFLIVSKLKNGIWELQLCKKSGITLMKKTVKYRLQP